MKKKFRKAGSHQCINILNYNKGCASLSADVIHKIIYVEKPLNIPWISDFTYTTKKLVKTRIKLLKQLISIILSKFNK